MHLYKEIPVQQQKIIISALKIIKLQTIHGKKTDFVLYMHHQPLQTMFGHNKLSFFPL